MTTSAIFVKGQTADQRLGDFAKRVTAALNLLELEERESSNYAEGHYFRGLWESSRVKLYYLDAVGLEEYLFAVLVDPSDDARAALVARALAKAGFSCFVPAGPWHLASSGKHGTVYEPAD
jgi:hypothetical protein